MSEPLFKSRRRICRLLPALLLLALAVMTFSRNGVWRSEETLAENILKNYPGSQIANYQIAVKLTADGKYQAALRKFERVSMLGSDPQLAINSMINISQLELLLGNDKEAQRIAFELLNKYPNVTAVYKLVQRVYHNRPESDYRSKAKQYYNNALFLYYLAADEFRRADNEKAKYYLQKAVGLGLMNGDVFYLLARIAEKEGDLPRALKYYKASFKNDRFNKNAFLQYGRLKIVRSEKGAGLYLKKALRLDPDFKEAWYNLGLYYLGQSRDKEAAKCIEKARELKYPVPAFISGILKLPAD